MKKSKKLILGLSSIVLVIALILSVSSFASAEDVVVEEYKDTSLEFASIWGQPDGANAVWKNKDEYIEDLSIKNYKIRSNAFAPWFNKDCVSFAYKKMDFAYGKQGTLTVETQLNSWDAKMSSEAGAGIMLRTSNASGAVNLMFHVRPSRIMATYRALEDGSSVRSKMNTGEIAYPVSFKVVLNNNKATCFIKQANQKTYASFAAIPFVCGNTVLAGIAAYSQYEDEIATADFTGFHSYITTPEGAERVEGDESEGGEEGGNTSSGTTSSEEVKLPEDAPVQENVLLSETFTSGKITHTKEELPTKINWKYNTTYEPGIVTNSDNTNRYIYDWMVSDRYYFGGDQHWSDYTMTMDLTFTDEYSMEEANRLEVYVRHNDIAQYGVHNYGVAFNMVSGKQYISLIKRAGGNFTALGTKVTKVDEASDKVVNVEVQKDYLPVTKEDVKTKQLKIRAFDNKITVWYDGELIIDYTDNSSDIKGFGSIGWQVKASAVQIDNIKVIKETDLLGGDYDNEVCGNWDAPIPELIQLYDKNEWER